MKKAVSLILTLLMVLSMLPAVSAATAVISGTHDVTIYRVENNVTDYSTVLASKKKLNMPAALSIVKPYDELGLSQGGKFEGEVALAEVHVTLNGDFSGEGASVTVNGEKAALVTEDKLVFFATLDKTGGVRTYRIAAEKPYENGDPDSGRQTESFNLSIDYTNSQKAHKTLHVQVAGVPEDADYAAYMVAGKLYVDFADEAHDADVKFTFTDENNAKFAQIAYVSAQSGSATGEQKLNHSTATFRVQGDKLLFAGETAQNRYVSVEIPVVFRTHIQPADPKGVYFVNRTQTIRIGQTVTPAVKALNNVSFRYTLNYADNTSSAIGVDGTTVTGLKEGVGYITLTCTASGSTYTDTMKIIVTGEVYQEPSAAVVTAQSLNVRAGAGTAYARVGTLHRGDRVSVLSVSGGWAKIAYNGGTAYVSARYLGAADAQIGTTHYVVCRALNVRSTASTRKPRIGVLYRGDAVKVLSIEKGWAKIAYNGGTAYVSAAYIAK